MPTLAVETARQSLFCYWRGSVSSRGALAQDIPKASLHSPKKGNREWKDGVFRSEILYHDRNQATVFHISQGV